MIDVINLRKSFGQLEILKGINITINKGDIVAVLGPSGSGKSTFLRCLNCMEDPTSGSIIFNGVDITDKSIDERAKLGIGFAFQQPVSFKGLTVYDLLKIAVNKEITRNNACDILSKVGLCALNYVDREVNNSLSGGELKRIEIASVMARNPKLAIFDEPEAGIDLWSFQNLTNVFKQIQEQSKGITLVISHQERILNIADQIILLEDGKIKKVGSKNIMMNIIFKEETCCKGVNICE